MSKIGEMIEKTEQQLRETADRAQVLQDEINARSQELQNIVVQNQRLSVRLATLKEVASTEEE